MLSQSVLSPGWVPFPGQGARASMLVHLPGRDEVVHFWFNEKCAT